ncbi:hypothetical protein BC670_1491 [Flavobacterium branchiophilum]|uniref:Uncharacterized protein n=1 Tax=Flavobacterium branchiophilum TaxID=55197 RepID=A0A543G3J9_9FLAO|nr:hypothetical protein BC670_1491 [Flavobacterium branchiophilum]
MNFKLYSILFITLCGLAPYKSDFLIYVVANIQKLFISLPCKEQTTGEFYTDV